MIDADDMALNAVEARESPLREGASGCARGLRAWRIWWMLALNDVQRRYRRSRLGQFWITASMATTIGGIGLVYSTLLNQDVRAFLPFLAVNFIIWGLISSTLTEGCTALIEGEALIKHTDTPHSVYVFRVVTRNVLVGSHNVVLIPIVFLLTWHPTGLPFLWLLLTVPLLVLNLSWMALVLAVLCARYRDLPQLVASVIQILFFVTPVMFRPEMIGEHHPWLIWLNPFAHLLSVVRDPVLGTQPTALSIVVAVSLALTGWIWAFTFAGRYIRRTVFWL